MKSDSVISFSGMHLRSVEGEVDNSFIHTTHVVVVDFNTCWTGYYQIFMVLAIVAVGLRHRTFTNKVGNCSDTAIVVPSTNYEIMIMVFLNKLADGFTTS